MGGTCSDVALVIPFHSLHRHTLVVFPHINLEGLISRGVVVYNKQNAQTTCARKVDIQSPHKPHNKPAAFYPSCNRAHPRTAAEAMRRAHSHKHAGTSDRSRRQALPRRRRSRRCRQHHHCARRCHCGHQQMWSCDRVADANERKIPFSGGLSQHAAWSVNCYPRSHSRTKLHHRIGSVDFLSTQH